ARPNTPACCTSTMYTVLPSPSPAVQVRVPPSTTSNAFSPRRVTRWLRFMLIWGGPCSLKTCGALGDSNETSLTEIFSTLNCGPAGRCAGAAPPLGACSVILGLLRYRKMVKGRLSHFASPAAAGERQVGLQPAADAALEHVHALEAGLLQPLGGVAGGEPGLAHQHHRQRPGRGQFLVLRVELAHLHVLRARDVALVEVGDRAQVHHQRVLTID